MAQNKNISFTRGDSYFLTFNITSGEQHIIPERIYFTVKESEYDVEYKIQKTLSNGVIQLSNGNYQLTINPQDTENLEIGQKYGYDIEIIYNGITKTILIGTFTVTKEYTLRANEV